ncbi:hypothetical protein WSK_3091 [Novosphingobium sp. Rr 2-17]|uniref:hypothetical protein n=1 Tax=Novosphingobium sp. Rr 2-17 TaxID=555793 RepID=UPI0002697ED5|nr:hypothetical protein [Novosphingobium sp. Rr 2-17]EIZ78346.1 hypothetical protein WSK_3091 [Novosphingobium sp. Rr 2-17]
MSEDARQAALRNFSQILSCADDEAFLLMVWGVNALQSGNPAGGSDVFPFGVPNEVITEDMSTGWSIYPWELETIANEILASPKSVYQSLACNRWETVPVIINLLRKIDDLDFLEKKDSINIFSELFRLGGRQFEWQRGYLTVPQFYRNIYIYGQGVCAEYFKYKHGIGINELTVVGFGMYASFMQRPNFTADGDFELLGVNNSMRDKALAILAAPLADLRQLAGREREKWNTMAYRPSILRRFPCVRYGRRIRKIRSPLPALILERITSGLFYDVIDGGGPVRDDYGRRFEQYALRYLRAMIPTIAAVPEASYKVAKNRYLTPDIIVSKQPSSEVELAIECKSTRMSFGARFADEPATERGYDDIVKGIFQLWRYFSHCRRGYVGRTVASEAIGLVLTLDSWMVMNNAIMDEIFARASAMSDKNDPFIETQDRRPIAFCAIPDFEMTLTIGTTDTFLEAVRSATERDHLGGPLYNRHEKIVDSDTLPRPYPFTDLAELLPWWGIFEEGRIIAEAAGAP